MKKYIIFLIITINIHLFAQEPIVEDVKIMQLYLDKNLLEKVEELYDDNEERLSSNGMALERLAISFERREKYKEAIDVYRKIINNFYKSAHERVISTPIENLNESDYANTSLPFYYYKLAFLNAQRFNLTHEYSSSEERAEYKKNAEDFILLSRKVNVDNADLKLLEDQLEAKLTVELKMIFVPSWYASFDVISWQDRVVLNTKNSQSKINLLSTSIGSCLGIGKKWENSKYEFDLEGCFAMTTATISSEIKAVSYEQSSVAVNGLIAGPGMYYKGFSDNLLIGVHLPVKYRSGDWTNPNENLYEFQKAKAIEVGYFLQSKIKIRNLALRTRLGKVFPNPGSLWSIGIIYDF